MISKIGEKCFSNSGLEELYGPASLKEIGVQIISYCRNLRRVVLGGELQEFQAKSYYNEIIFE